MMIRAALAVALALCASLPAAAQEWPAKPIRIVVPFSPGGVADNSARVIADKLGARLGQQVIVENRAGASGNIGTEAVAKAAPDGYTLLLGFDGTMVINPAIYTKIPYQTLKDFVPIARTAQQPLAFVVHPDVKARSIGELIALAKASPGKMNYGSAGNGGISHLVPEMFKQTAGIFMVHIPYRGSAPAFTDLMAGQVQVMAESIPQAAQYVKAGKIRALAVTSRERNPALPDTPTMIESGLKNFEVVGFYGVLAPAGTPKAVADRLSAAFRTALESPDIRSKMVAQGADPAFLGADDFAKFLAAEMPKWAQAVKDSGARLD